MTPCGAKASQKKACDVSEDAVVRWEEEGVARSALWHSEGGVAPPKRIVIADDRMTADAAFRLSSQGTGLLWRGDFQNARQLLNALARRVEKKEAKPGTSPAESFHLHRQAQAQRARILGLVLLPFEADYTIPLRRAPDVREACMMAFGPPAAALLMSLRELQGVIGAYEWRKRGVEVEALKARIHPYYGVFAPVRGEYVGLVARAPLPTKTLAFDIGCGTGVLAAVLAMRGVERIIATDSDPRALACATENLKRLGWIERVAVEAADLFPGGRAGLIVCNPPWIPARPSSPIEHAIYDPHSRMLLGFLKGLAEHLEEGGEGWLILSDIAEHLGLRTRAELLAAIAAGGLVVLGRTEAAPVHPKAFDATDPLYAARRAERTSLWRLARA
jgi:methylase of polypeptide subunit release factors